MIFKPGYVTLFAMLGACASQVPEPTEATDRAGSAEPAPPPRSLDPQFLANGTPCAPAAIQVPMGCPSAADAAAPAYIAKLGDDDFATRTAAEACLRALLDPTIGAALTAAAATSMNPQLKLTAGQIAATLGNAYLAVWTVDAFTSYQAVLWAPNLAAATASANRMPQQLGPNLITEAMNVNVTQLANPAYLVAGPGPQMKPVVGGTVATLNCSCLSVEPVTIQNVVGKLSWTQSYLVPVAVAGSYYALQGLACPTICAEANATYFPATSFQTKDSLVSQIVDLSAAPPPKQCNDQFMSVQLVSPAPTPAPDPKTEFAYAITSFNYTLSVYDNTGKIVSNADTYFQASMTNAGWFASPSARAGNLASNILLYSTTPPAPGNSITLQFPKGVFPDPTKLQIGWANVNLFPMCTQRAPVPGDVHWIYDCAIPNPAAATSATLVVQVVYNAPNMALTCGDGMCDPSESCSTCAQDCGACSVSESPLSVDGLDRVQ